MACLASRKLGGRRFKAIFIVLNARRRCACYRAWGAQADMCCAPRFTRHKHAMEALKLDTRAPCRGIQEQSMPVTEELELRRGCGGSDDDGKRSTWRGNRCEATRQCRTALKACGVIAHLVQNQSK